jgi:predicted esterase
MLKDKFMSINYAPNITTPIIIFHGKKDKIVKYEEGVKLYNSIKAKKKFISDNNLGHVQFDPEFIIKEYNKFNRIKN